MVQWIRPILHNINLTVSENPTPIFKYIKPTIDIIKLNHLKIQVKNIAVTINNVHEKYDLLTIETVKLNTTI